MLILCLSELMVRPGPDPCTTLRFYACPACWYITAGRAVPDVAGNAFVEVDKRQELRSFDGKWGGARLNALKPCMLVRGERRSCETL